DLFVATGFEGELRGSEEGMPEWVPLTQVEKLPYLGYVKVWLPLLLGDGPALSGLYRVDAQGDVLA
ncbi:MAG TPA: DNA mismatch repair protein MutT, partial [Symbiobacteriaceae bacterium]|nr:DNA mismatch repair protein MutT [Symbiobacteriaceae bacterium]